MSFKPKPKIYKLKNWAIDIIFPKLCLSCHREGLYICPECFAKIPIQADFHCYVCQKRSPSGKSCPECRKSANSGLNGLLIASNWQNLLVRQLIYECKYRFISELAQPLAMVMAKFLTYNFLVPWPQSLSNSSKPTNWQTDKLILVPVPLHKHRLSWRGFNQAKIICDYLTKYLTIPTDDNLIIRDHDTAPQMDIKDKKERTMNVSGAFKLNYKIKNDLKEKIIILVDDVCTTGATFNACAVVLKELNPKEIWGLAIARG